VSEGTGSAIASIQTDHCSTSTKRVVQSLSVHTAELFGNLALRMSAVTAVKRHIPKELAPTIQTLRQIPVVAAMAPVVIVPSRRSI